MFYLFWSSCFLQSCFINLFYSLIYILFVFSLFYLCLFFYLFLAVSSCPFSSIFVSLCLLGWELVLSFGFFLCFLISFVVSFTSSFLARHRWEVIVLSVSLMYFKSFFKFSIFSFVKDVILSSLISFYFVPFIYSNLLIFAITLEVIAVHSRYHIRAS